MNYNDEQKEIKALKEQLVQWQIGTVFFAACFFSLLIINWGK